jgi:putative hemolysin
LLPLVINPQATTLLAIVILFLLLLSFVLSGSEVAFFSLTSKDINILKTKQDTSWRRIVSLMDDPKTVLASMVIANTIINIAIIILANFLIDEMVLPSENFWLVFFIKVILIGFVMLLFGEIMPKIWATQNNLQFAYYTSGVIELVHLLFRRVSVWAVSQSENLERLFGLEKAGRVIDRQIEQTIKKEGSEKEGNILKSISKFGSITVRQVMRARLDVYGASYELSFAGLKRRIDELHYSRLPVYKSSLDELAGMIQSRDLIAYMTESDDFDWHTLLRPVYFVHEHKLIEDLLEEFQQKKIHFAVVVDEFGGTSGIVTLEDIMEEVVGDIRDEFDEEDTGDGRMEDGSYIFEGRTMLHDVCKAMNLPVDTFDPVKGDGDSLAGLILELSGDIPKVNDVVHTGDFEFTVLDADSSRIKKVKVAVRPQHS